MATDEDEPLRRPIAVLGEDLSLLSIEEIEERIDACRREIERLEAELERKRSTRSAADAYFRR
jgi:uncharacterized small protein (DUF1192 family)